MESMLAQAAEVYFAAMDETTAHGRIHQELIDALERPMIARALQLTNGNQIKAAALLGLNRNTLRVKLRDLGVDVTRGNKTAGKA